MPVSVCVCWCISVIRQVRCLGQHVIFTDEAVLGMELQTWFMCVHACVRVCVQATEWRMCAGPCGPMLAHVLACDCMYACVFLCVASEKVSGCVREGEGAVAA